MHSSYTPTILTIAGSDPYGGAGVQADIKTIHANGGYAFSAITALTAQNSQGVKEVDITDATSLKSQIETILDDIRVDAIKIGMLGNKDIVEIVIDIIKRYQLKNIVLDTVIVSSSGATLLDSKAIELFKKELIPLATIITPNLLEINTLTAQNFKGIDIEIESISKAILDIGADFALIKGGHFQNSTQAIDILVQKGKPNQKFQSPKIKTSHTHGTGCILSSAIATNLAKGYNLSKSVQLAKDFLTKSMQNSDNLRFNYKKRDVKRHEAIDIFK